MGNSSVVVVEIVVNSIFLIRRGDKICVTKRIKIRGNNIGAQNHGGNKLVKQKKFPSCIRKTTTYFSARYIIDQKVYVSDDRLATRTASTSTTT